MAGMFHMALSRADVTVTHPDGTTEKHMQVTATLRDGTGRARKFAQDVATLANVTELVRHTGKHYTLKAADGTEWDVLRDCGCGGG